MTRQLRALTLVEVLAAMALLGVLATALSSWLHITGTFASRAAAKLPWEAAAEQTLARVQDDLLVGDFTVGKVEDETPRCSVIDGRLTIRTRDPRHGTVMREYRFDPAVGRLDQLTRPVASPNERADSRPLLGDVGTWSCALDGKTQLLTVIVRSSVGPTLRRSFACPP